ncbi:MAG: hypothetical protein Q4B67_03575 [Eubacteriales bacterium]|nr:hypothetical protein [Eubacteriales bacterium]
MNTQMIKYACDGLFANEMEDYLEQNFEEFYALNIITGAPISIYEKMERLVKFMAATEDDELREEARICVDIITNALSELEHMAETSVIIAETRWQDYDDGDTLTYTNHSNHISPCASFIELKEAILDEIESDTDVRSFDESDREWYEFVIWNKTVSDDGRIKYQNGAYRYVMIRDEICFVESIETVKDFYSWKCLFGSSDLNLPVPFNAGDIVTIDCRPFADPQNLLITDARDRYDCCGLRGAFCDEDGNLHIDSVKHGHCFPKLYRSRLSPLYRMKVSTEPLKENEKRLERIQQVMLRYPEGLRDTFGNILEGVKDNWF